MSSIPEILEENSEKVREAFQFLAVKAATSESVSSQLPGRENGPADAYRHLVWAAEMSRRFGPERAAEILDLHERQGSAENQTPDARVMDEHNNEIANLIGPHARTWDDVVRMAFLPNQEKSRDMRPVCSYAVPVNRALLCP